MKRFEVLLIFQYEAFLTSWTHLFFRKRDNKCMEPVAKETILRVSFRLTFKRTPKWKHSVGQKYNN